MWGFLVAKDISTRGRNVIENLYKSAERQNVPTEIFTEYRPCKVLFAWGWGAESTQKAAKKQLAAGNKIICWDLGYWDRGLPKGDRKFRVSINAFHPPVEYVMADPDPAAVRWKASGLKILQHGGNPKGPILLVGNGPKSVRAFAKDWATERSRDIRQAFPGKKIMYHPKPNGPDERNVDFDIRSTEPIDRVLPQCSLVVCRHSNVALDAARFGVPVVCQDGFAKAIYPSELADWKNQPTPEQRLDLLKRVGFWQWSTNEIKKGQFWKWARPTFDI